MAETGNVEARPRRSFLKAFRPFFVWLVLAFVLLAILSYRKYSRETTTVVFRVAVEGRQPVLGYSVTLNGVPYRSGQKTTIGRKTLVFKGPEFGSAERKCFVWFGTNDLGLINLPRLRGSLEVNVAPKPQEIRVKSPLWGEVKSRSGTTFARLPVGEYRITAVFQNFQEERNVQILGNKTTRLEIKPVAGWVWICAEPPGAEFHLSSASGSRLSLKGRTPRTFLLPAGDYQLRAWRGNYVKNLPVHVATGGSNEVLARFEYGAVQFVTTPRGAVISEGYRQIGRTPDAVSGLIPGPHRFRLQLPGYVPVEVNLQIQGNDSVTVSTNLVNQRFAAAMERARWELRQRRPNYRLAMANVEEALQVTPESAEALEIKTRIEAGIKEAQTRIAAQQSQRAATRRMPVAVATDGTMPPRARTEPTVGESKKPPAAAQFANATASIKDAALFDTHVWTFGSDAAKVREAVLRTLRYPLYDWTVERVSKISGDTYVYRAKDTALHSRRRYCVVLVSQAAPGESVVYAKFWQYRLKPRPLISFGSGASSGPAYVPVHTNYFDPKLAVKLRKALADSFKAEISKHLK